MADWLVRYAIEAVHAAIDAPGTASLRALCGPLNIPIRTP
jgi:hypothetical protein